MNGIKIYFKDLFQFFFDLFQLLLRLLDSHKPLKISSAKLICACKPQRQIILIKYFSNKGRPVIFSDNYTKLGKKQIMSPTFQIMPPTVLGHFFVNGVSRARVWGGASNLCVHDSIKPAGLVRRRFVKFVGIQFYAWALRSRAARIIKAYANIFYVLHWFISPITPVP